MDDTWTDVQGGTWTDGSDWSAGSPPGAADTALITTPGTYGVVIAQSTTVGTLSIGDAGATVLISQPAGAAPTSFAVLGGITLDAGRLAVDGSAQTALGDGGAIYTMDTAATLDLSGGIAAAAGEPGGAIVASIATLDLIGSQTLDHATLVMSNDVELLASSGTATLGAGFVLEQTGSLDGIDGSFVNQGLMEFFGSPWVQIGGIAPGNLTNDGTIATGPENVLATLQDFANAGLLDIGGIFNLNVGGSYANTGTIALAAGGTFDLDADTALAALGQIDNAGGVIGIGGTLDLAGGTLAVAAGGTFGNVVLSGELRDGTVAPAGGTLTLAGGTFDGIAYDGVLNLATLGTLATLDVTDGLTVQGGTVDVGGAGDRLQFLDSETLDHLTVNLGAADGCDTALAGDASGTLALGADAALNGAGGQMAVSAQTFVNGGSIAVAGGTLIIAATTLVNAGTLSLTGAGTTVTLDAESLSNSGTIAIGAGDTLVLESVTYDGEPAPAGFTDTGTITMVPGSELVVDTTMHGLGTITGSGGTLVIAPTENWFSSETSGVLDLGGGTLVVGGTSAISALIIEGTIEDGRIVLLPGGTLVPLSTSTELNVTDPAPCYLAGTRLGTPDGEVAVEDLGVGQLVLTAAGEAKPVVWIGQRRIDCRRHRKPELVWPVRVRAGAFGPSQPSRDLLLSPDHAVCVAAAEGGTKVLIPIKHLENGLTIAQEPADSVHYFHVELERHGIVLAEGLPAESYLDSGNRAMFVNGGVPMALHPDFWAASWASACAPLCQSGPDVEAARERLRLRARSLGWRADGATRLHVLAGQRVIAPASVKGKLHRFLLPAGAREVRVASVGRGIWDRTRLGAVLLNGRVIDGSAAARLHGAEATLTLPATPGPLVLELLLGDSPGASGRAPAPLPLAA